MHPDAHEDRGEAGGEAGGVMPREWRRMLWLLRISVPALGCVALGLLIACALTARWWLVPFEAALVGFNAWLTYIEWFVLQPEWPGRRLK